MTGNILQFTYDILTPGTMGFEIPYDTGNKWRMYSSLVLENVSWKFRILKLQDRYNISCAVSSGLYGMCM